nr:uncharacterized protein LOC129471226 [Symphalangus syndactylus]
MGGGCGPARGWRELRRRPHPLAQASWRNFRCPALASGGRPGAGPVQGPGSWPQREGARAGRLLGPKFRLGANFSPSFSAGVCPLGALELPHGPQQTVAPGPGPRTGELPRCHARVTPRVSGEEALPPPPRSPENSNTHLRTPSQTRNPSRARPPLSRDKSATAVARSTEPESLQEEESARRASERAGGSGSRAGDHGAAGASSAGVKAALLLPPRTPRMKAQATSQRLPPLVALGSPCRRNHHQQIIVCLEWAAEARQLPDFTVQEPLRNEQGVALVLVPFSEALEVRFAALW